VTLVAPSGARSDLGLTDFFPVEVLAGEYTVEVARPGYRTETRPLSIAAKATETLDVSTDGPGPKVGYKHPPKGSRFRKGQSGNPKGRPRGRTSAIPYDAVLGRKVLVRDNGIESHKTAAEAFLLHLARRGLDGDGAATRAALESIEEVRVSRRGSTQNRITAITYVVVAPGNPNAALLPLMMARKLDRFRDTARVLLEPWLVEAALARLGARRLTHEEQQTVVKATRTPHKVRWPDWWSAKITDGAGTDS